MELIFFFCLLVKHATADLFLQTIIKPPNNKLAWLGSGHKHYRDHAICNFIVCIFFVSPMWALLFSILDYVIHWHIDWSKILIGAKQMSLLILKSLEKVKHFGNGKH